MCPPNVIWGAIDIVDYKILLQWTVLERGNMLHSNKNEYRRYITVDIQNSNDGICYKDYVQFKILYIIIHLFHWQNSGIAFHSVTTNKWFMSLYHVTKWEDKTLL